MCLISIMRLVSCVSCVMCPYPHTIYSCQVSHVSRVIVPCVSCRVFPLMCLPVMCLVSSVPCRMMYHHVFNEHIVCGYSYPHTIYSCHVSHVSHVICLMSYDVSSCVSRTYCMRLLISAYNIYVTTHKTDNILQKRHMWNTYTCVSRIYCTRLPISGYNIFVRHIDRKKPHSSLWSKEPPPPGGVSYTLCSLVKNREQEDPPRRTWYKFFEGCFLTHSSWWGNIVNIYYVFSSRTVSWGGYSQFLLREHRK